MNIYIIYIYIYYIYIYIHVFAFVQAKLLFSFSDPICPIVLYRSCVLVFRVFSSSFGLPFVACAFRSSLITKFAVEQKAHLQVFKSWWNGWGDSEVNMGKIRIEAKIMCWNIASATFPIVFFVKRFYQYFAWEQLSLEPGPFQHGTYQKKLTCSDELLWIG